MRIALPFGRDFLDFDLPDRNHLYTAAPVVSGKPGDPDALADAAFDAPHRNCAP